MYKSSDKSVYVYIHIHTFICILICFLCPKDHSASSWNANCENTHTSGLTLSGIGTLQRINFQILNLYMYSSLQLSCLRRHRQQGPISISISLDAITFDPLCKKKANPQAPHCGTVLQQEKHGRWGTKITQ